MVHIIVATLYKGIQYTHCGLEYQPGMTAIRYEKPIGQVLEKVGKHLCGGCIQGGGK